jgi:hypothetical protein
MEEEFQFAHRINIGSHYHYPNEAVVRELMR